MATRFRALAAPVDVSTGDERRFTSNITVAQTPIPLRWPREDIGAHDGAVTVGAIDKVDMTDGEIWVEGRMFDDVDPAVTPRLAEDVAHAMTLAREGVLGISVDLDDYEATVVRKGSDEPLSEAEMMDPDMPAELLITKGRIRACTLVDIPAFAETNHTFEMYEDDEAVSEPDDEPNPDPELASSAAAAEHAALVASMAVLERKTPLERFTTPPVPIEGPTPMVFDFEGGIAYGHIYEHGVCHVGFPHECRTPPVDEDFRHFHHYPVETTEGVVFAGRITAGGVHPPRSLALGAVRRAYDDKTTVAYVRASVDDYGIFVCGPLESDLDDETIGILSRRKVSGHWPEVGAEGDIWLAEILALAEGRPEDSEPGFPISVHMRNGRMVGMTAALGPMPKDETASEVRPFANFKISDLVRDTYHTIKAEEAAEAERAAQATQLRVELAEVMSADAARVRDALARAIGV